MTLLIRFFGVTAMAAFLCALLRRGSWSALVELETFGCLMIGMVGVLLVGASQREWACAWRFIVRGRLEDEERLAAARWFYLARQSVLAAGTVTYCVGIIWLLSNLSSPAMLGQGMATALFAVLYAVAVSELFFYPLAVAATRGLEDAASIGSRPLLLAFSVVAATSAPLAVLLAAI